MTVELAVLLSLVGAGIAVAGFLTGRTTAAKTDGRAEGALDARVATLEREMGNVRTHLHGPVADRFQVHTTSIAKLEGTLAAMTELLGEVRTDVKKLLDSR